MSSYRLEFGKRRGKTIRELDNSYLQWLAARDVYVDEDNNNRTAWCERTDSECPPVGPQTPPSRD